MTVAVVCVIAMALVVGVLLWERNRAEARWTNEREVWAARWSAERAVWTAERTHLTNAVIARHPGEAAALNRSVLPRPTDEIDKAAPKLRPIGM